MLTSESASEGHPDKLADRISDAVVDAILRDEPESHIAVSLRELLGRHSSAFEMLKFGP